jgi:arginine/ornithine N-succinyltransferase beta subunit
MNIHFPKKYDAAVTTAPGSDKAGRYVTMQVVALREDTGSEVICTLRMSPEEAQDLAARLVASC